MSGPQILEKAEAFVDPSGDLEFHHTAIVFRDTNSRSIFLIHVPDPIFQDDQTFTLETLENLAGAVLVSPERVFPLFDPSTGFTICPNPNSSDVFVKRPSLLEYTSESDVIRETFLQEAQVCETLLKNFPHVNIAQYLGCEVEDSRITGLCFTRYQRTLFEKVEQNMINNSTDWDFHSCIEGVRNGIEHLHKHGYCHNDINPSNIMLDANDSAIIIDFDSCRPEGDDLGLKGGTLGWNEKMSEQSQRWNDLHGLSQIQNFLETSSEKR